MRVSDAYPSTYLKAADLQNRNVNVIVDRVEYEKLGEENKPVLYFKNKEKGMILNRTNANTISMVYGDDTDDWEGGDLTLYSTRVDFQGKSVDAIRVRVPPRKPARSHATDGGRVTTGRQLAPINGAREDEAPHPSETDYKGDLGPNDDVPF